MGDLILAEVLQGFRSDADYLRARTLLTTLPFFSLTGYDRALATAENYRSLRKRGVTIRKTVDVFIASTTISNFCTTTAISMQWKRRLACGW